MDDPGNLVNETTEVMSETINASSELRKRRSTRIVQAVPLQVTGVDALGRPFVERTSSLILNCHGCRYQSKHYVLKNMWVKLEIPNPAPDRAPRTVRGRVAWIQRPRTVRQLFQVALELEVPGNVWGIAFPPEDWFPYKEPEAAEEAQKAQAASAGAALGTPHAVPSLPPPVQPHVPPPSPAAELQVPPSETELAPAAAPDNLRVFPSPSSPTDASLQMSRHMTRLLAEARQQIQAAAREAAAQAVSAERRLSAAEWEQNLAAARQEFSKELASAIQKIEEEFSARSRAAHDAATEALQADLDKKLLPQLEELAHNLLAKISEESNAQRTEHVLQLASAVEERRAAWQQAEETITRLRESAEQSERQITAHTETARQSVEDAARQRDAFLTQQREALSSAATEFQEQAVSAFVSARSDWQSHVAEQTEAAQTRWQAAVNESLAAAQERSSASLNEHTNTLLARLREETERQSGAVREAAAQATSEVERRLASLRESLQTETQHIEAALTRAGEASGRLENFSARLETAEQQALTGFQSQVDDVLSLHRNELHRRSELMFDEIAVRIRSAFEVSQDQAISRFNAQIDGLMQPQLSKAEEAVQRLAGGRALVDAALTLNQDRIRSAADDAFSGALLQFQDRLRVAEQALRDSADMIAVRSLAELEGKAESMKQQAVEDLMKSTEWYEKKAQTQVQSFTERAGELAAIQLREKAGEITNEFAAELDQSSRNFVSYAQTQMADVVSEAFERTRALFAEAAETTSAAFVDEIQRQARQDLEGFEAELRRSAGETRTQMESAQAELTQKLTAEQEAFLLRFRSAMSGAMDAGVAQANQRVQAGFEPLLQSWKATAEAHEAEMRNLYTRVGEQAANQYRERLDNVSNQWMLATVSSLDHQSRDAIAGIAASAEQKLRETCAKVFADLGDVLRDRLQQIALKWEPPAPHANP